MELVNGATAISTAKMRYYPYGQEVGTATANDTVKFATYTRDAHSGVDYAMNRYYMSTWGRFTTADPYRASGGPGDPGSWNRYSYVQGDPVNYYDPLGLQLAGPGFCSAEYSYAECVALGYLSTGGGPEIGGGGGGGGSYCWVGLGFASNVVCIPPIPRPPAPPTPDIKGLCEELEIAYITTYLARYKSPLLPYASEIFYSSEDAGLDYRFIVALAGVETSYGRDPRWGPYNGWNSVAHKSPDSYYENWSEAIQDTIKNLNSRRYARYNSTLEIYSLWERGNVKIRSERQATLDQIYGRQLGGDLDNVRQPRCAGLE